MYIYIYTWGSSFQYLTNMKGCFINLPSTGLWSALKGPSFKYANHEILVENFTGHVIVLRCPKNNDMKILTFKRKHISNLLLSFSAILVPFLYTCVSCEWVFHPSWVFFSINIKLEFGIVPSTPCCFFNQPGLFNDDLLKSKPWKASRWRITGLHLQSYHLLADFQMNCTPWNLT